jgi:hypothetical protein
MSRNHTLAAVLFAFAAGYFLSAQPAKADLGVECARVNTPTENGAEKAFAEAMAGGREHAVAVINGNIVCAW